MSCFARNSRSDGVPRALSAPARVRQLNSQPMTPILNTTRIYVDADACPVKDEIYRVAARHGLPVSVVAGQFIRVPQDPSIERIAAGSGMDAADDWIAERAGKGDIVITSDIPLASRCVKAGAEVIAPNGKPFTEQSIGMTLAVRNLMTDLRSSDDTDSSTPDNSGVPPKVSLMSFNWISGGAMAFNSTLFLCRWLRALALDAADGLIERRQERRAVARSERFGSAGHLAG